MCNRIAVGLVLFNPKEEQINNLKKYSVFTKIYIFDNSITSNETRVNKLRLDNLVYLWNGQNNGISKAFNCIMNKGKEDGITHILCMDQDSEFTSLDLKKLKTRVEKKMTSKVAVYAASTKYATENKDSEGINEVDFAITSGSVLNLSIYEQLGGYDENLFIDSVDRDYSIRVKQNNFKILQDNSIVMQHQIGDRKKNLVGVNEHNAIRNYYIFRNRLYIMDKFKNEFNLSQMIRSKYLAMLRQLISILFFEKDKIKKFKLVKQAIHDFKKKKFGKMETDT